MICFCKSANKFHYSLASGESVGLPARSRFGEGRGGSIIKDIYLLICSILYSKIIG